MLWTVRIAELRSFRRRLDDLCLAKTPVRCPQIARYEFIGYKKGASAVGESNQSLLFNCASFAAMNARMSSDMSKSFSHCSLYKVTGSRKSKVLPFR